MLGLVSMFSLCAEVATANAQLSIPIRAKIPFDFFVGDKKLPAGEYTLGPASGAIDSGIELVRSVDASASALRVAHNVVASTAKDRGTVVFHKYGDYQHKQRNRMKFMVKTLGVTALGVPPPEMRVPSAARVGGTELGLFGSSAM